MIHVIFLLDCATISNTTKDLKSLIEQPTSLPAAAQANFISVESDNPPLEGVWMSWDDAREYAYNVQKERLEWQKLLFREKRDYALEKIRSDMLEKQTQEVSAKYVSFWSKWGFPIGLSLGIVIGISATIVIVNSTPRGQ